MPSCAVIVQPAWSFGIPSISIEAHTARSDRGAEPGLVAEDGDLDPGRERRLDEAGALRHLNLTVVDDDGDELRR